MARVRVRVSTGVLLLAGIVAAPASARAQQPRSATSAAAVAAPADSDAQVREELDRLRAEFEALRRTYDERLQQLEQRLTQIGGGPMAVTPPGPRNIRPHRRQCQQPEPAPAATRRRRPGPSKVFNPGHFGERQLHRRGRTESVRHAVAVAAERSRGRVPGHRGSVRARGFLSRRRARKALEVEEGYITFTSLPANLLLKAGKMRAHFGKMNTLHTHALPSVDRPLVTANLVGGDEGSVGRGHVALAPHQQSVSVPGADRRGLRRARRTCFRADSAPSSCTSDACAGIAISTTRRTSMSGASFAFGPTTVDVAAGAAHQHRRVADVIQAAGSTSGWSASTRRSAIGRLSRAIYRRLNVRTELIWSRQEMPDAVGRRARSASTRAASISSRAGGTSAAASIDRAARSTASAIDTGGSVFLTFWPTEFSQIRGQFRRINFAEGVNANEFLFQFNFSIGAHGAHVFLRRTIMYDIPRILRVLVCCVAARWRVSPAARVRGARAAAPLNGGDDDGGSGVARPRDRRRPRAR